MGVGASRLAAYGYGSSDTYTCKNTYSQYTYGRAWCVAIIRRQVHTLRGHPPRRQWLAGAAAGQLTV